MKIRVAETADAAAIQAIYAPTVAEMARRIQDTLAVYPYLVAEDGGRLLGYVYASAHRARAAYRWSVDVTAYVAEDARRGGVGRALYGALIEILTRQGFHSAYAGIALPESSASDALLHHFMGHDPRRLSRGRLQARPLARCRLVVPVAGPGGDVERAGEVF